jgi:hypothetical protein
MTVTELSLRDAFDHVLTHAVTGALDAGAETPRPRLAGLVDEDLLGVLHACHQVATLADVVREWAAAEFTRRRPAGWATTDPVLGTVKVPKLPTRGAERHDLDAAFHLVACEVMASDELPAQIIALITRLRDLFAPASKLSVTALDVQGIPRASVVSYDPPDLTTRPAVYTPPKGP